jgi:hypothetical protein
MFIKSNISNATCPRCKYVFEYAIYVRLCRNIGNTLTQHAPMIPSYFTEIYHGDISEMPGDAIEYDDGPNPYELRMLLQSITSGEQEAAFE